MDSLTDPLKELVRLSNELASTDERISGLELEQLGETALEALPELEALLSRHEKLVEAAKQYEAAVTEVQIFAARLRLQACLRDIEGGPTA